MKLRAVLAVLLVWTVPAVALAEPSLRHVDVFQSGQGGYYIYRIPIIETAPTALF